MSCLYSQFEQFTQFLLLSYRTKSKFYVGFNDGWMDWADAVFTVTHASYR